MAENNTDNVLIEKEEQLPKEKTVVDGVIETLKDTVVDGENDSATKTIANGVTDTPKETTDVSENKDEDAVPTTNDSTTTKTVDVEETTKLIDEQENENVNDNATVPASVSPGRANVPFKEVNDEAAVVVTPTVENHNTKKRELEQDDEQLQEKTDEIDERNGGDQVKKIKRSEPTDTTTDVESTECVNNITNNVANGHSVVEVWSGL